MNNKVIYVDFKNKSKKVTNAEVGKQGFIKNVYTKIRNIFSFSSVNRPEFKAYNFKKTM